MARLSLSFLVHFLARLVLRVRYTVTMKAANGATAGEVSWVAGTPVVPVRDILMPELVEAWARFPGSPDQPVLRMKLEVKQGIPSFTRVEIESRADGAEIIGAHFGLVREHLEFWRDMIVQHAAQDAASSPSSAAEVVTEPVWADSDLASSSLKQARRGAPRKATAARHERVAAIYRAHANGKPLEAIVDAYRGPSGGPISRRTASRYVKEAEVAGYLPPATVQGKKRV